MECDPCQDLGLMYVLHYLHNTMLEMFYFTKLLQCCTQKVCFDIFNDYNATHLQMWKIPTWGQNCNSSGRTIWACCVIMQYHFWSCYCLDWTGITKGFRGIYSLYMLQIYLTNFHVFSLFFWTVVSCWLHGYPIARPYCIYGWYTIVFTRNC